MRCWKTTEGIKAGKKERKKKEEEENKKREVSVVAYVTNLRNIGTILGITVREWPG